MNTPAVASLQPRQDGSDFAESSRFEVRSVTGVHYTIVEQTRPSDRTSQDSADAGSGRRYRTAYAGLPVTANDDGSFTIVDTHTRLVRVAQP
jgi:hypothetical protein